MDKMIDHVNQKILIKRGYDPMPLHLYSYYQKVCTYCTYNLLKDIIITDFLLK